MLSYVQIAFCVILVYNLMSFISYAVKKHTFIFDFIINIIFSIVGLYLTSLK